MSDKLKPCPFCGGEEFGTHCATGGGCIQCQVCAAEGPWAADSCDAWSKWNNRAGEPPTETATKPAPASDAVNHPAHYNSHPSGVECISIARHMGFNLGNVVKYIWRAGLKGPELEDLRKAKFYLEDEIKLREGGK